MPGAAAWPSIAKVLCNGLANLDRKRELRNALAFSTDGNHSCIPVDVVQCQGNNLTATKPQARQQKQDRIVTSACSSTSVTTINDLLNLILGKISRNS